MMEYDGELASSILLDDGEGLTVDVVAGSDRSLFHNPMLPDPAAGVRVDTPPWGDAAPPFSFGLGHDTRGGEQEKHNFGRSSLGFSRHSTRGLAPHARAGGEAPNRTPTRTPSPVYQWNHQKVGFGGSDDDIPGSGVAVDAGSSGCGSGSCGSGVITGGCEGSSLTAGTAPDGAMGKSSSSTNTGIEPHSTTPTASQLFQQVNFPPLFPPYWPGGVNPQAYYSMMLNSGVPPQQGDGKNPAVTGIDPAVLQQMMIAMQATAMSAAGQTVQSTGSSALPGGVAGDPRLSLGGCGAITAGTGTRGDMMGGPGVKDLDTSISCGMDGPLEPGPLGQLGGAVAGSQAATRGGNAKSGQGEGKKSKSRNKDGTGGQRHSTDSGGWPGAQTPQSLHPASSSTPKERGGGKGDRRRRGGSQNDSVEDGQIAVTLSNSAGGGGRGGGGGGKSRSSDATRQSSSNPMIESLKARDRHVELADLAMHISEIAQDQYGSRLIQQKLEIASDEDKAVAFKSVLQKMPHLTTDVFGNYVIQKFFEYGSAEQRRILAEQLVGQVLKLALHMYGCRVVQKALDSVPIEQQVLLIGELKGHVLKCIEDQHGNHVIQKCIERLPTDRIGFIVESFLGQTSRMAKHCYGCRVIQRLIEYCASMQISPLLDETLKFAMELATDQYGNYVVQHVMEHSSRPGDRQMLMATVRKNILNLSCHKYASNVIEKALGCGTLEERALLIQAIVGEPGDAHPPLMTMMKDRFGNYIVQRVIMLAQGPQREAMLWKLHEYMPSLKKSNTYGKHIITAMERAQALYPAVPPVTFRA